PRRSPKHLHTSRSLRPALSCEGPVERVPEALMRLTPLSFALLILLPCACPAVRAQSASPDSEGGLPPFVSTHGGDIDSISLGNGNLTIRIPLMSFPQRGKLRLEFDLIYNGGGFSLGSSPNPPYRKIVYGGNGVHIVDDQRLFGIKTTDVITSGTPA